jgi:hypothetical protein
MSTKDYRPRYERFNKSPKFAASENARARHYTDYSPEKLGKIYEKAAIKILINLLGSRAFFQ